MASTAKVVLVGGTPAEHAGEAGRTWDGRKDFAFSSYNYAIGLLRACALADDEARDAVEIGLLDFPVARTQRRLGDAAIAAILAEQPDVVGLSCACWNTDLFAETARHLHRVAPGVVVVAGGPGVTHDAEARLAASEGFDVIVRGEGERPFVELCRRRFRGYEGIPGVTWRDGGRVVANPELAELMDLGAGSSPYLSEAFVPRAAGLLIEPSRGCRFRCSFCSWSTRGGPVRWAPRARIAAEVAWAVRRGYGGANFCDTAINHDTERLRALCEAIAEGDPGRTLRCSAFLRHEALDGEQLAVLADYPFSEIILGIESLNPAALRSVGKAPIDPGALERRIEDLGRRGSRVTVSLISGLPGDSLEGFAATLDWAEGLLARLPEVVNLVCCFWLAVLPGTRYAARAEELGMRSARLGTPYLLMSRAFSSMDLVRMARMLVERGARTPRLACEEVHGVVAAARDPGDLEAVILAEPPVRAPRPRGRS